MAPSPSSPSWIYLCPSVYNLICRLRLSQVGLVEKEFAVLGDLIAMAGACQKPEQSTLEGLLGVFPPVISAVSRAQEVHRRDREWSQHLNALGAGAPVIGWVAYVSRHFLRRLELEMDRNGFLTMRVVW